MANSVSHSHPRPQRARHAGRPAPEPTARPHGLVEELGSVAVPEESLSVFPEDLGSHFLSEAVEQGDLSVHETFETERALLADAELDDTSALDSEISLWTRILDRAAASGELEDDDAPSGVVKRRS